MIIAPEARADLLDIFTYISAENRAAARHLVNELLEKMRWIAETGFTGTPRNSLSVGLRSVVYRERCIFYRIHDQEIHVVRIIHGRRDLGRITFSKTDT